MKCLKCETDMKKVSLLVGLVGRPYLESQKGIFDAEKQSMIDAWVCPACGYIELQAVNPEQFKNI